MSDPSEATGAKYYTIPFLGGLFYIALGMGLFYVGFIWQLTEPENAIGGITPLFFLWLSFVIVKHGVGQIYECFFSAAA